MSIGLWTAAAGATAQSKNLEIIANNLANVDTPAFKADQVTFKEYLAAAEKDPALTETVSIPKGPLRDRDLYPLDGRDAALVTVDGTHTQFHSGALKVTQSPLDLALEGKGFLQVLTPDGIRYTRYGRLQINPQGQITTTEGHPILKAGPSTGSHILEIPAELEISADMSRSALPFKITAEGEVFWGKTPLGKLSIVEFQDLKKLRKVGMHLFESFSEVKPMHSTWVRQGSLETSNVNPIRELTQMIQAHRSFENDLKALKTFGELMEKEVNVIGKL